jgi:hypothetical protein
MKPLTLIIGLIGATILPYECSAQVLDNPFSEYFQRQVTIAPSGGNANDTNAAIHTIDPWPAHSRNTRIPGNGRMSVESVERMYKSPFPLSQSGGSSLGGGQSGQTFNLNLGAGAGSGGGTGGGY